MILRDWREADPAAVHACYERERQHWLHGLSWDTTWTWATVEQARFARGLPGFLATDDAGRVEGWTFYVVDDGILHIGGLVADSDAVTRSLLDGILHGGRDTAAEATACFVLDRAAGLAGALEHHGFVVERFHYLSLPLASGGFALSAGQLTQALRARFDTDGDEIQGIEAVHTSQIFLDEEELHEQGYDAADVARYVLGFTEADGSALQASPVPGIDRDRPVFSAAIPGDMLASLPCR